MSNIENGAIRYGFGCGILLGLALGKFFAFLEMPDWLHLSATVGIGLMMLVSGLLQGASGYKAEIRRLKEGKNA